MALVSVQDQLWLKTAFGGCAQYQNDRYQRAADGPDEIPGNPWFISTLWLGECMIARAESLRELHEAVPYLEWCAKNALLPPPPVKQKATACPVGTEDKPYARPVAAQ